MNRHGRRFVELRDFKSHANSLNVRFLRYDELEFYEKHCLLLPAALCRLPPADLVAVTQRGSGWPVESAEDLEPPETLRGLWQPHVDGLHPFDVERENNPLLLTPDCTTFEPWNADDRGTLTAPDSHTVQQRAVERYYSPWQVHVVEFLRQRKYYDAYSRFLRHVDPFHKLWSQHRLPEDTERTRSLRGMADGFEALERFRFAEQVALEEAYHGVDGATLPEPAKEFRPTTVRTWARRSLEMSGLDQPAFFRFLHELVRLVDDYRADERIALADDTEEYLLDAQRLVGYTFGYDWDGFLAAAEEHVGPGLSAELRWLDPVEAAVRDAKEDLNAILAQHPVRAISDEYVGTGTLPEEFVQFCLDHDLLEVLYGLQRCTYTETELRSDRFPGSFHRGLRSLALSGEQLTRGILHARAELGHEVSVNLHRKGYRQLVKILGEDSSWLDRFKDLGKRDSERGDLERAVRLAEEANAVGAQQDDIIAHTLAAAVATRNLVSHRHKLVPFHDVRTLAGPCADALVLI